VLAGGGSVMGALHGVRDPAGLQSPIVMVSPCAKQGGRKALRCLLLREPSR
jgi:hypothetical protein